MLFLQNGKGVRIGAILRRGLLAVSWLGVTSHAEAETSQEKKSGGVLASALEKKKTLSERQMDEYKHVCWLFFVHVPWVDNSAFFTLSAAQLREVEQIAAVKEREELAVRFFLQNKWGEFLKFQDIETKKIKRNHLIYSVIAFLGWALPGVLLYGISHKKWGLGDIPDYLTRREVPLILQRALWGAVAMSGVGVGDLHRRFYQETFDSLSQQHSIGLWVLSLTGLGAGIQILVIYFVACNAVDKKLEIDEPMKELRHPYDPFEEVQLEYIRQKYGPGIRNEELCAQLERVGRDCYRSYQENLLARHNEEIIPYIREGLALYRALTPLTREERAAYREEILKKTRDKLQYYHPDVQKKIYDMVDAYLHGDRVYGRILAGPPGTGKTELAKTLASLFPDGECVEIKLGGRSPAELEGDAEGRKGYFVEALLQVGRAGKKVRVICFDEMEKSLDQRAVNNRELLVTVLSLENGEYCLYSAYFNAHFVLQVMRFYPVNSKEELDMNEALLNRLPVVDVPGYSAEAKYKLYTEPGGMLEKMLASMHLDLARKDDPEVLAMLKDLIATDEDPGLRTLEDQVSMALTRMDRVWHEEAQQLCAA